MKNQRICQHLNNNPELDYAIRLTGNNNAIDFLCEKCAKRASSKFQLKLFPLVEDVISQIQKFNWLEFGAEVIGEMNLPATNPNLKFESKILSKHDLLGVKIKTVEPHPIESNKWFVINASGELLLFDIKTLLVQNIYQLTPDWIDLNEAIHLTVSIDGNFVAVANSYKVYGEVINVQTSSQTMKLERSDYHVNHCFFPLVFTQYRDIPLLIHASDWDHLDISDPLTGLKYVTHPEKYDSDKCEAFNRSGSFHGELVVSPNQQWLVDNGWEWHPVGVVSTWNISNWIENNPWEFISSESLLNHTTKEHVWGQAMCWVDNKTICISGWGEDDYKILPGVSMFDIKTGYRSNWFYGPYGALVVDEYLFSYNKYSGISVWDMNEGTCLLNDKSVGANNYHPIGKYFIDIHENGEWLTRRLKVLGEV